MEKRTPKDNSVSSLFGKIGNLTKKKITDAKSALDALAIVCQQNDQRRSKACSFASQIAFMLQEDSLLWVDSVITYFAECATNGKWFSSPKSSLFLFALNISSGTPKEVRLRILADYVLSHEFPRNEEQLFEQFRIMSLILHLNSADREYYPSGAVCLLTKVLSEKDPLEFKLSPKSRSVAIKYFTDLQQYKSVREIYPELVVYLIKGKDMEPIYTAASKIRDDRIAAYLRRRVYPPMIQMLEPMLTSKPKERTDEQKQKKALRKIKSALIRQNKKESEDRLKTQLEKRRLDKEKKEKTNRLALAQLNEQNTYTLDIAAVEPKTLEEEEAEKRRKEEEEVEEEENVEQIMKKATYMRDPDISDDFSDSEEDEEEDE